MLVLLLACGPAGDRTDILYGQDPESPHSLRVVTLAPNLAELVFAAGAGSTLVGVSAYSDYPHEVAALPLIGDAFVVDQELLALIKPDILLAWQSGTPRHVVDRLSSRGYRVEVIRTRTLEDIALALEHIGELTGFNETAANAAAEFRQGLVALAERHSEADHISVFYQIQTRPLYTLSGDHYISELIGLCGGQNIFSDLNNLAPLVAVEAVIERNPEVLLVSSDSGENALNVWDQWPDLAAIRFGNRYVIQADHIGRPTPRILLAGEALCKALQQGRINRGKNTAMNNGTETVIIRDAKQNDWQNVRQLLDEAGLPVADLSPEQLVDFLVAERPGTGQSETLAIIGLQRFDEVGLLRSLVVSQGDRNSGLGRRLVSALEANACCAGVNNLWLLTIDAERYFESLGYKMMSRDSAPESIRNTAEFSDLCPDGAFLMRKVIG